MKVTKPNLPALFVGVWVFTLISGQVVAQTHEANFLTPDVSDSATVRVEEDALGNADSLWWAWCAEAHCMSTDSAVWFAGMSSQERGRNLDTANIVLALSDLDRRTQLDLYPRADVLNRVAFMLKHRPRFLAKMMGRSPQYFPLFEAALDRHNLPLELKYLPVLESGLNPLARSGAGATGLWQFMYNTGRHQGLEINSWVDERRDPIAATEAACRFLSRLNKMYDGDWHLALAAYNAGPGNVNKAIRRAGSRDFWKVKRFLPRETAKYVPSLIALVYLFSHPVEAGIVPSEEVRPASTLDTIMVQRNVRFDQVAMATGRPVSEIAQLNPQYRKEVIPGAVGGGWPLVLPQEVIGLLIDSLPSVLDWEPQRTPDVSFEPEVVVYRVRDGDVLGTIANRHRVSVRELKQWNGLRGDVIRVGQKLYIHADPR
jgi:membrane-bound lytic murein transglycosylase D